ncbi:STAS domain-containing protein [Streptomyces tanashiensis]|uniref:STAS domain-containing protein n=1 Tax=Streptomyces tanashiensis TaxID=67367 RepID=UPI00167D19DF|nr:STAS domain-containing protein [Streptomyces tanashiensis]GGY60370.1 hypothetical protein GCM10010299_78380 [Streptomyces tanashiensis]
MTIHPRRPTTVVGADISGDAQPSVVAVDFEPGHQRVLARVCGEVDIEDADELGADLAAALDVSVSGLDVDLSAVTFCDCSCLHMLFRLNRRAGRAGKTLVLTALGPRVDRLLRLTETEHLFTVQARPASAPAEPGPTPPLAHGNSHQPSGQESSAHGVPLPALPEQSVPRQRAFRRKRGSKHAHPARRRGGRPARGAPA